MNRWQTRSVLYRAALAFFYLVFLLHGLAFSIPSWFGPEKLFFGLWLLCKDGSDTDLSDCDTVAFGDSSDWMDGVRGCWVGSMFFCLLAVLYGLAENCCRQAESKDYGITGVLAFISGMCGAAGMITAAVKTADDDITYRWGFILGCVTSGLLLILGIVLIISRQTFIEEKSPSHSRTADYVYAHKPSSPHSSDYNHGFARDDVPLANGVTYHHSAEPRYNMYRGGDGAYPSNSLPRHPRQQNGGPSMVYHPYGYDMSRGNQRYSMAESADLSNGFTNELIQAEHSLSRNVGHSGRDFGRGGDYMRHDYYMHGSRPY